MKRVLVVEDTYLTAESLSLMLLELGYAVAGPVPNTREAGRILDEGAVDAAVLDVDLRGELVTPVAERLVMLGVPFVFLTAYLGLDPLPEVYRAFPTVAKPCSLDVLARALEVLFEDGDRDSARRGQREGVESSELRAVADDETRAVRAHELAGDQ
jgi:DNA-binding NtrC family response regulator